MDIADSRQREQLAFRALAGYVSGPGAPITATHLALERIDTAVAVILVEGISDQIAIETLASRQGRDLDHEGIVVLPMGGAQAITRFARQLGPAGERLALAGFCDADATTASVARATRR